MGSYANPVLSAAASRAPVTVAAGPCSFDPFAPVQATPCAKVLGELTKLGVPYAVTAAPAHSIEGVTPVAIGASQFLVADAGMLQGALEQSGYDFGKQIPTPMNIAAIIAALLALGLLSGLTYGSVAALLSEMFPPHVRYSSMSIPYHIGTGYFGGFLPFIASFIIASTGDAYAGLWYTWGVVAMALVVTYLWLPDEPAYA
jgi:MFS family permease